MFWLQRRPLLISVAAFLAVSFGSVLLLFVSSTFDCCKFAQILVPCSSFKFKRKLVSMKAWCCAEFGLLSRIPCHNRVSAASIVLSLLQATTVTSFWRRAFASVVGLGLISKLIFSICPSFRRSQGGIQILHSISYQIWSAWPLIKDRWLFALVPSWIGRFWLGSAVGIGSILPSQAINSLCLFEIQSLLWQPDRPDRPGRALRLLPWYVTAAKGSAISGKGPATVVYFVEYCCGFWDPCGQDLNQT